MQLTINIPDNQYSNFLNFLKNIPNSNFVENANFVLTNEQIEILDLSSQTPYSECISIEDLNQRLNEII